MVERVRITEALVKQTAASGRLFFIRDDRLIGFALQVTPGGTKSFIAEARVGGRNRRFTIGQAGRLTVDEARSQARLLLADMARGTDPQTQRRAERERSSTLREMLDDYVAGKSVKESTANKYRAQLRRNLPDWLDKPIADISPQMVRLRFELIEKRSRSEASGTMRTLRAVCRPARDRAPAASGRNADDPHGPDAGA